MSNDARLELSRRRFIAGTAPLIAGAAPLVAASCRSNSADVARRATPVAIAASSNESHAAPPIPELEVVKLGTLQDGERGGTAVVILHGFGARGDDLVPLARRLMQPRSRFFVPAAPLPQGASGRAWWHFDAEHPLRSWAGQSPPGYRPNPDVLRARAAVQGLLRQVRAEYAPERLLLAGFSQGGMLTLDVALAADPSIDRAASLSGLLIPESIESLQRFHGKAASFFLSHGRADGVLPFAGAEATRTQLVQAGLPVTFLPFEGGHEIPDRVVSAVSEFLFG